VIFDSNTQGQCLWFYSSIKFRTPQRVIEVQIADKSETFEIDLRLIKFD